MGEHHRDQEWVVIEDEEDLDRALRVIREITAETARAMDLPAADQFVDADWLRWG